MGLKKGHSKNNLAKRRHNDHKFCCFCSKYDIMKHIVLGSPSTNVEHLFGTWLKWGGRIQNTLSVPK
jgi:hypothetical protein